MKPILKTSLLLGLFMLTSLVFTVFVGTLQQTSHQSNQANPKFGIKGLPYGRELSKEFQSIDKDYVYFDDRVLRIFTNNTKLNQDASLEVQSFMDVLPQGVNRVVALIPMAITYEPYVDSSLKMDSLTAINEIKQGLDESIQWINVDGLYAPKTDEYIYLRTDAFITTLGAYYIAQDFLVSKGIEQIPLAAYLEDRRTKIQGTYFFLEGANLLIEAEDNGIFYLLEGASNTQELTLRISSRETRTFKAPTISVSRRGLDVFVGGVISDSKLYGDGLEDSIIVIGDHSAKVLATWLTPYFKYVFVIDSAFYMKTKETFFELFELYQISDVILVQTIENRVNPGMNSRLKMLYE
jgi:hypothetical protein